MQTPRVRNASIRLAAFMTFAMLSLTVPASSFGASPGGAIVFSRAQLNPDSTLRSNSLWLTAPSGSPVRALTPVADGVYDGASSWSPDGTRITFQRRSAHPRDHSHIYTLDPAGGRPHRLTHGAGSFEAPAWGPGNEIAFVSKYRDRQCLSLVDARGRRQRDLFCPPSPAQLARPVWTADGASLLIVAGYYVGRVEPLWRSLAYRIDARTGAVFVLTDQTLEDRRHLEFAPDGSRGIYAADFPWEMVLVDFAADTVNTIGYGYAPRWSKDGQRIAFTGEVFEDGPPFRYYEPLFVMSADGTNVRRITRSRVDNHAYTAAEWSDDGIHLLVNRRIYADPALTVPRMALRIVNADTQGIVALPQGYAEPGAWFER